MDTFRHSSIELVLDELGLVMTSDQFIEVDTQYELDLAELSTYIAAALSSV